MTTARTVLHINSQGTISHACGISMPTRIIIITIIVTIITLASLMAALAASASLSSCESCRGGKRRGYDTAEEESRREQRRIKMERGRESRAVGMSVSRFIIMGVQILL